MFLTAVLAYARPVTFDKGRFDGIEGVRAVEEAMFATVNAEREKDGLSPLIWDELLASAARQHSDEMTRLLYFSHDSPTPGLKDALDRVYNAGLTDAIIAENLASENNLPATAAPEEVGKELTAVLMASREHRENILDPRYTHSGVGCALSGDGTIFCTELFSKKLVAFNSINITEKNVETLEITLSLKTDQEVGVWIGDRFVQVFEPEEGVVNLRISFPLSEGPQKVVFAQRPLGSSGKMLGFFLGEFDARRPIRFASAITDVDVVSEEQIVAGRVFYYLELEGEVIQNRTEFKIADGNIRYTIPLKSRKFKTKYAVPAGSGIHELYFVAGDEAGNRLLVNADVPLAGAFCQLPKGD